MRQSVMLLIASAAGVLGGGALVGVWALGVCLIFVSLAVGALGLLRDDGATVPTVREVPSTLHAVLERARSAS